MAKKSFSPSTLLSRLTKGVIVILLIPVLVGMAWGVLEGMQDIPVLGTTAAQWARWGFTTYIGFHLLLYKPAGLFQASHRIFSTLAVWLFGGQVTTVDEEGSALAGGKVEGSPLVAFSPYVVPLYPVLISALALIFSRWIDRQFLTAPAVFLIGMSFALHWFMSSEDMQEQRDKWYIETYLLALGLVFLLTLLIAAAALPWALPEFSFARALEVGAARTREIYMAFGRQLF